MFMKNVDIEELKQLYIVENKTRDEVAKHFGVKPYVISNIVTLNGLQKPGQEETFQRIVQEHSREELQELYRKNTYSEVAKILNVSEDILNRVLKYYGLGKRSLVRNVKDRVSKEVLEDLYINQNKTLEELTLTLGLGDGQNTRKLLREYEITKPKSKVQENIKRTLTSKYGVTSVNGIPGVSEKREQTCLGRYGAKCVLISSRCKNSFKNNSKPNQEFAKQLEDRKINFIGEFPIENRAFDFKVGNVLIEINPYATHNSNWGIDGKAGKDVNYHRKKSDLAEKYGYFCLHVWDWDNRSKILDFLGSREYVDSETLSLEKINRANAYKFYAENSIHSVDMKTSKHVITVGLDCGGDIKQAMTFSPLHEPGKWEIKEFCTKMGVEVPGGAQKIWKYFTENYNPSTVTVSYDRSKESGKIFEELGFVLENKGEPNKHIYSTVLRECVEPNSSTVDYGRCVEIWDAGQSTWIWKSKE